jgi:hypothetical protein
LSINSGRALEEALQVRLDFRWLAERTSRRPQHEFKFRIVHAEELKKLYVQFAMIGIEFGTKIPSVVVAFRKHSKLSLQWRRGLVGHKF